MNDHVAAPRMAVVFPPNPVDGHRFDAPNGVTYGFDGVVWTIAAAPTGLYILRGGDDVLGELRWNNPGLAGVAVDITQGSIQVHGGGVRVEAPGEVIAPVFVATGDPAG